MLHLGTKDIETERVVLRKFRLSDATNMFNNWANSASVTRYLSWNPYTEMIQCEEYIKKVINQYNEKSFYNWAIELKEIGEVIGSVNVDIHEKLSCAHISFCIGHKWWNQRIMQEVVVNLIPVFLEEIQVERLESCYESGNNTAGKVLIRSGFQSEAIQRKSYLGIDGPSDMIWFSILKDNYFLRKRLNSITLEQLYITNYKETGGKHFKSITRLKKEEAFILAKKLSSESDSKNDRYGQYFERYYEKRVKTEDVLYQQFVKNGGKPHTQYPIYFVLCDNQGMADFYGNGEAIRIPLSQIPSEYISFTPRDSMHLMDMGILNGNVWSKNILFDILSSSHKGIGNQIIDIPSMYGKSGGYIEVQVWNDSYINSAVEKK